MPPGVGNAEPVAPLYAELLVASLDYAHTALQAQVCLLDSFVPQQFLCRFVGDIVFFVHDIVYL
jgi:hypothetical protein